MISRWNDAEAARFDGDLGQRVYTSRLIGQDPALVLHGGGNTSVKTRRLTAWGEEEDVLYVKGSGRDLATIDEHGFAPVRLSALHGLAGLERLSDLDMARELRAATADPTAPAPSVEAILHALIPHRFVDHTHADAVIAITNTPSGARHAAEAFGSSAPIVPYVMPGFDLARRCREVVTEIDPETTTGLVLMAHGVFSFGSSARESYERMIDLVSRAERYLQAHGAWELRPSAAPSSLGEPDQLVSLRSAVAAAAGRPLILRQTRSAAGFAFANRPDRHRVAAQGPATPDHVIRTKRLPLLDRDVDAYAGAYRGYFERCARGELRMLDPAPRVVLDPLLGLCTVGASAADAGVTADIYEHTIEIIERAELLESWQALPEADIFAVEYWDLEQAKLSQPAQRAPFAGEVAVVTGAASGIGRACAEAFLLAGAAVCGLDVDERVGGLSVSAEYLGLRCDVTEPDEIRHAFETLARAYGGLDLLVLSAGVFPDSRRVGALDAETWRRTFSINLDANLTLLRLAHPWLKQAPGGGRVVIIGSKNVPAPGVGAAAYSASKAALTQLARVSALEWGPDDIRVNVVHPNAVFDTGLWSEEIIRERARQYGVSPEEYRRSNVLGTEVRSTDVARLVTAMCGTAFAKTTGAQVPIDGGNERVI